MRIRVHKPAARKQRSRFYQGFDDRFVGGPVLAQLFSFHFDDVQSFEAGRLACEAAFCIDGERDAVARWMA